MAEKDIAKFRQGHSLFDTLADRRECPHLGRCVRHERTGRRPARPWAAAGPAAAAPAAPATTRRRVGRVRVRRVAAVSAIAAVAATACRAGSSTARCAMALYGCCASSHVEDDTGYPRCSQALVQTLRRPTAASEYGPLVLISRHGRKALTGRESIFFSFQIWSFISRSESAECQDG